MSGSSVSHSPRQITKAPPWCVCCVSTASMQSVWSQKCAHQPGSVLMQILGRGHIYAANGMQVCSACHGSHAFLAWHSCLVAGMTGSCWSACLGGSLSNGQGLAARCGRAVRLVAILQCADPLLYQGQLIESCVSVAGRLARLLRLPALQRAAPACQSSGCHSQKWTCCLQATTCAGPWRARTGRRVPTPAFP